MWSDITKSTSLKQIDSLAWKALVRGAADKKSAFRYPSLATRTAQSVSQRTLVLREVDESQRILYFFTDMRSPKVQQIQQHAASSLLFYDARAQVQLRLQGHMHCASEAVCNTYWKRLETTPQAHKDYSSMQAPGSKTPTNQPLAFDTSNIHFGVLYFLCHSAEFLALRREAHLRGYFDYTSADPMRTWLVP